MYKRLCADGDGRLSFEEFRSLSLLVPNPRVEELFTRGEENLNFGYYSIPKTSKKDRRNRTHSPLSIFCSGGMAGLISRTITAPADRVKVKRVYILVSNN